MRGTLQEEVTWERCGAKRRRNLIREKRTSERKPSDVAPPLERNRRVGKIFAPVSDGREIIRIRLYEGAVAIKRTILDLVLKN